MRPTNVSKLLAQTIPANLPVLLTGSPGIGKSDLVRQAAEACGYDLIVSHPVVSDPTDAKGLPWPDAETGRARFLPVGELAEVLTCKRPTVWLIDDLGQAPAAVQASYMGWLLARRFGEHCLPDHVSIVAATNGRAHRANVSGILEPVKSRFATIIEVEAHIDDWCNWAIDNGLPAEEIAFLRFRPALLCDFRPTADLTNSPNPRTWASLAKLFRLDLPAEIRLEAFAGCVSEGTAVEVLAFLQMFRSLASIDGILVDPMSAVLPSKPDELYAVSTGLAARANDSTFGRICSYCDRLLTAGHGEFAGLVLQDSLRRQPDLATTTYHTKLMSGPLGRLIMGIV